MNAKTSGLIALEQEVLTKLLRGDDLVLRTLLAQYSQCVVTNRELTGCGFFTNFSVISDEFRIRGKQDFSFGDVKAEIDGLEYGAGFVLFVQKGKLKMLEGFSYEEPWPIVIGDFRVEYLGGKDRDLSAVQESWSG